MENFIGISRDIVKHWIYNDSQYFHVWFEMLHRARYSKEPTTELIEGQVVEINYSEFVFGRKKWSEKLGISEQRLRTLIKKMTDEGMLESTGKFNRFSLYRIKNYEKYNQQTNQHESQSYQGINYTINQQNNQQSTSIQPASNQQLTTKEESKERSKKEKKVYYAELVSMTPSDHKKLIDQYGPDLTNEMVSVLDNYKGSKGKTYKDDYRAILSWVIDRVNNQKEKPNRAAPKLELVTINGEESEFLDNVYRKQAEANRSL